MSNTWRKDKAGRCPRPAQTEKQKIHYIGNHTPHSEQYKASEDLEELLALIINIGIHAQRKINGTGGDDAVILKNSRAAGTLVKKRLKIYWNHCTDTII
ncbi:MAG: hypothetical protein JXR73_06205 [Candidatus Omnitrophica bacterium]|nr:hypothetical protein [Candidatus Omnitrophota bacterium]